MPREPQQRVFATRAECVAQVQALTEWARAKELIGPHIEACSVDTYYDGAVGHWVEDWMLGAHGVTVEVDGKSVTIDLSDLRRPVLPPPEPEEEPR